MALATGRPAQSAPVTFDFSGTVAAVQGSPLAGFPAAPGVGASVTGAYSFDPTTPGNINFTNDGINTSYRNAITEFNIAGFNLDHILQRTNFITVAKSFGPPGSDFYGVGITAFSSDEKYFFDINLAFFNQNLPGVTSLPAPGDLLLAGNVAQFDFEILDGQHLSLDPPIFTLLGFIDRVSEVPEPSALFLFIGSLVAALAATRSRRARRF